VYVDHYASVASAQFICDKLNEQGFSTCVEHDHAIFAGEMSCFVVSIFSVSSDDAQSLEEIESFITSLPREQIERYEFNSLSNQLTVIHNPLLVTASDLATDIATKTGAKPILKLDGDEGKVWEFVEMGEEETILDTESLNLRPTVMLSGIFWIVSMLSYIGGNW
jgi:hypothetical protein